MHMARCLETTNNMCTYLPPNSSDEVFILMTAIAVRKDGHFVLLTWSDIQHCHLVGLTTGERKREREERERERERMVI